LKDRLGDELRDAMRAGDQRRRDVLRSVLTAVNNSEIARVDVCDATSSRQPLTDDQVLEVLQKQAKQRRESIEEYRRAGRADLLDAAAGEAQDGKGGGRVQRARQCHHEWQSGEYGQSRGSDPCERQRAVERDPE